MKFYDEQKLQPLSAANPGQTSFPEALVEITPETGDAVVVRGIPDASLRLRDLAIECAPRFEDKDAFKAAVLAAGGIPKWDAVSKTWIASLPKGTPPVPVAMAKLLAAVAPFVVFDETLAGKLPVPVMMKGQGPTGWSQRVYACPAGTGVTVEDWLKPPAK